MLPEGTKTCKICGHVLWRDEEKDVCESCKHDLRDFIAACIERLVAAKKTTHKEME